MGAGAMRKIGQTEGYEKFKKNMSESRIGKAAAKFSQSKTGKTIGWATGAIPIGWGVKRGNARAWPYGKGSRY